MIAFLLNLSIKKKLIAISTLTATVALLLACSAFVNYELSTYRESATVTLLTMAQMIGGTSTAALTFGDSRAATETLDTLRSQPHILEAGVYARNGAPLARYSRNPQSGAIPRRLASDGAHFGKADLSIYYPVMLENDRIGTVYVKSDLTEVNARLSRYGWIALGVLIASILAALTISSILQRLISGPILQLAEIAGRVSSEGDYTIRTVKKAEDETGVLVDRFNEMLEQIQARDEALQGARDKLEQRVNERTTQLQAEIAERKAIEKHLILAKDAAEASSRAKSEFLANMSHELRTPLNAIIGYSEMLEEDAQAFGVDMIPDLRRISGAGKHLLTLINEVLDLSKIEAGRLEVHPEVFRIQPLLDDVAATAEPLARKGDNRLVVKCEVPEANMCADPLKLRQSLLNLLSNACKFTEKGTITLGVGRRSFAGSEWFEWTVSDTGSGIPPEQMHKLFKSFSQVDSSSTRKHGGTGLGLAISQRLCELMGGKIMAESQPGVGSKFSIRLPSVPIPSSARETRTGAGDQVGIYDPQKPQIVLIIDDDPSVQDLLGRALQKRNFVVISAADGREGLRMAIERQPSVIVLDIRLPDLDGWAVFRTLRADPRFKKTPILVHTITDTRPPDISLDGAEFLQKPVAAEQLVAILRKHSTTRPVEPEDPPSPADVTEIVRDECPHLFEMGAGGSILVRRGETSKELISFDLKVSGDGGRELLEILAASKDWRHVSLLRRSNPPESGGYLLPLLAAVQPGGRTEPAAAFSAVEGS